MARFRELLRDRDFSLLWFGQMVSQCGDRLTQLALVAIVTGLRPGSAMELALLIVCTTAPTFCVGPFAGVFVDRWDRRRTMIVCDLVRAALVLGIAVLMMLPGTLPLVYLSVFLIFSATRFFLLAKLALVPELVTGDRLLLANSVTGASGLVAAGLSFAVGGWVIVRAGVIGGLVLDMASYLVSAAALALMHVRFRTQQQGEPVVRVAVRSVWHDLVEGIRWLVGLRHLRATILAMCLLWSAIGLLAVVGTVWVQHLLDTNPAHLGFLVSLLLAGVLVGSLLFGRIGGRWDRTQSMRWSLVGIGGTIVGLTLGLRFAPSASLVGALMAVLGLVASPAAVCTPTVIQERLPQDLRGRIFSSVTLLADGAMAVSLFIGAAFADRFGAAKVLLALGVGLCFGGLLGFRRSRMSAL